MDATQLIPEITHPWGKVWDQPDRQEILIENDFAIMNEYTFDKLADYSASHPSGVYEGKMWKRHVGSKFYLMWYGPAEDPNKCSINHMEIIVH